MPTRRCSSHSVLGREGQDPGPFGPRARSVTTGGWGDSKGRRVQHGLE